MQMCKLDASDDAQRPAGLTVAEDKLDAAMARLSELLAKQGAHGKHATHSLNPFYKSFHLSSPPKGPT